MVATESISLPRDFYSNFLMFLRWIHFLAGITWIGLLYFFNLVGFRTMQELDPPTRAKAMPGLMSRAMWWFRWSALVTVLAGLVYWGGAVSALAQSAGATSGAAMGSFFGIWTAAWGVLYLLLRFVGGSDHVGTGAFVKPALSDRPEGGSRTGPGRAKLDEWLLLIVAAVVVAAASCLSSPQSPRLGDQFHALHRHRRRHRLGPAVERLGSSLAHPKTAHRLDQSFRRKRNSHSRSSRCHVPPRVSDFTRQRMANAAFAFPNGGGEPLPNIQVMAPYRPAFVPWKNQASSLFHVEVLCVQS
jgi:uncharacterized membrane protein